MKIIDPDGFGNRLREAFKDASNAEIARQIGVSDAGVKNYIEGRIPPAKQLDIIIDLTNCSLHWLLTGKGPKFVASSQEAPLETETNKRQHPFPFESVPPRPITIKQTGQLSAISLKLNPPREITVMIANEQQLRGTPPQNLVLFVVSDESLKSEGVPKGQTLLCIPGTKAKPDDRIILN